ncbi:MAG: hypothetical protein Q8S73_02360 [Deltaproteobacteria bacterium]|nr:hypothetical protein [Myxococcales bacterium]MDP3212920.1 hypothetical protein [Deltaproteobacteria bacterium]
MEVRRLAGVVVAAWVSACAGSVSSSTADGGRGSDVTTDAAATACGLGPLFDFDREGVATPDGVAAWVDFSRASDERLVPPIEACAGQVRLPVMVRWTAPRAGFLRVRVQRDPPSDTWTTQLLTVRRLAGCAWDSAALGCSFEGFRQDPGFARGEYEFPVSAGPQWLVFAWTFAFGESGVTRAVVPALRVALEVTTTSAYNAPCGGWAAVGPSFCPARSVCATSPTGESRCIPEGSSGGLCRIFPHRGCDEGLGCANGHCIPAGGPGEACVRETCRAGSTCSCIACGEGGVCVAFGGFRAPCREAGDPRGECDDALVCRRSPNGSMCSRVIPLGAPCEYGTVCADGGSCAVEGSNRHCILDRSEGAACRMTDPDACLAGLQCRDGRCVRAAPRGAACAGLEQCAPGLACVDGRCGDPTPERCTERPDSCPTGEACFGGRCERASGLGELRPRGGSCLRGLSATESGVCVIARPGDGCWSDAGCRRGTVCRDQLCVVEGQCAQLRDSGSVNEYDGIVCGVGARCVGLADRTVVCRPLGRDGGLCRSAEGPACDEGHRCVGGVCVAASSKSVGVCADHLACPGGTRCDLGCTPIVPPGQEGGRCRRGASGSGECDAGLRCDLATLVCGR